MLFKRYFLKYNFTDKDGDKSEGWVIYKAWFWQSAGDVLNRYVALKKAQGGRNIMFITVNRV
jgi:hypothetical protein